MYYYQSPKTVRDRHATTRSDQTSTTTCKNRLKLEHSKQFVFFFFFFLRASHATIVFQLVQEMNHHHQQQQPNHQHCKQWRLQNGQGRNGPLDWRRQLSSLASATASQVLFFCSISISNLICLSLSIVWVLFVPNYPRETNIKPALATEIDCCSIASWIAP